MDKDPVDGWYLDLVQTKAWYSRGRGSLCFRSGTRIAIRDGSEFGIWTIPLDAPLVGVITDLTGDDDITRLAVRTYG